MGTSEGNGNRPKFTLPPTYAETFGTGGNSRRPLVYSRAKDQRYSDSKVSVAGVRNTAFSAVYFAPHNVVIGSCRAC
jgi:hypothetical protein